MYTRREFPDWCVTLGRSDRPLARVSLLFFPLFAAVAIAEGAFLAAGLVTAAFLAAAVIHAVGRRVSAWLWSHEPGPIDVGPLGGLIATRPVDAAAHDPMFTAGAIANGLAAAALAYAVDGTEPSLLFDAVNPFALPRGEEGRIVASFPLLLLHANFLQIVLCLIPLRPFAAGPVAAAAVAARAGVAVAETACARLGVMAGFLFVWAAAATANPWLAVVGTAALASALKPVASAPRSARDDDPFGLADGEFEYAVESREHDAAEPEAAEEGWLAERRRRRDERAADRRDRIDARVDALLEKVHREGMDGLTAAERRFLKKSSTRYRS